MTVRHVPKVGSVSSGLPSLSGTQPIDVKAGEASSEETKIGTVGMGKVLGRMSEWTTATVGAVKENLAQRGAKVSAGAPRALVITVTGAEVSAIPMVGVTKSKIVLTATSPDGLKSTVEGSGSSMAPLGAINGAATEAVKKLLTDPAVDGYLRKH